MKDSKKLSRKRRENLEGKIKESVEDFAVVKIPADKIDEEMDRKSLNRIELERISDLVNTFQPDMAIVDATEVKTGKIEREIESLLNGDLKDKVELKAENRADENYAVVSAASILAKVVRDNSVEDLERRLNREIGNGYPSDQRTIGFLREVLEENGSYPPCVRKKWVTAERLVSKREQDDLSKFCDVKDSSREKEQ